MSIDKLRSELDWVEAGDPGWAPLTQRNLAAYGRQALSALDRIHAILDGREWDSSTASEVASVLVDLGYEIRPYDPEGEET